MIYSNIYTDFPPNNICPCGSSKKANECCLNLDGNWHREPSNLTPPDSITNFENQKCYAKSTKNCSTKITKEHYISENVLEKIADEKNKILFSGSSWIPEGQFKHIPIQTLKSNILCSRHNKAFSPVDKILGYFVQSLGDFENNFISETPIDEIRVFCGEDIERWMLKTICNQINSGGIAKNGIASNIKLNPEWIDILFDKKPWPKGWGLYLDIPKGIIKPRKRIGFGAYLNDDELFAASFNIYNMTFFFCVCVPEFPENDCIYRPKTIVFQQGGVRKYIEICWRDKLHNKIVQLKRPQ